MKTVTFGSPTDPVLVAVIFGLVILLLAVLFANARPHFRYRYRRFRPQNSVVWLRRDISDVGEQLKAVMSASFERRRILNPSEYRLFLVVEREMTSRREGYRVFAQTNLGEILRSRDEDAFHSINSKRVDILVVDRSGWPVLAIEYQGKGHYQGSAAARDAVKKEALRKAGVRYVEFCDGHSDEHILSCLREYFPESRECMETRRISSGTIG